MQLQLNENEHIEIYTSFGGGLVLSLKVTNEGLLITVYHENLKIKETKTKFKKEWLLWREKEYGYDRT